MALFLTEVKTNFLGHQIVLVSSSFGSWQKLYIDGLLVDSITGEYFPSPEVALLRGQIRAGNNLYVVEVYGKTTKLFWQKWKIHINGTRVAGEFD